ncbi:MAG: hypothetical protein IAE98_12935, partial [Candidatus Kapabacteria bacterium]|nr:hypothetical protein [Candidatus Kapabacteria bacterium]
MLNNKELLELAENSAKDLVDFIAKEKQTKTTRIRAVEELLSTRNRQDFIDKINDIIKIDMFLSETANELVNQVMINIAPDNIVLFVTLLRFKFLTNSK